MELIPLLKTLLAFLKGQASAKDAVIALSKLLAIVADFLPTQQPMLKLGRRKSAAQLLSAADALILDLDAGKAHDAGRWAVIAQIIAAVIERLFSRTS